MKNNGLMRCCIVVMAMLLLASCQKKSMMTSLNGMSDTKLETSNICYADSIKTKDYVVRVSMEAEFPKKSDAVVVNSIQEWISEQLGNTYSGDYAKGKSMLKFYVGKQLKELDAWENGMPGEIYYDVRIRKVYETDLLVTYEYAMEGYFGGAHGAHAVQGVTFRKMDGRRMDWSIFLNDKTMEVQTMITEAIQKQYFQIEDKEEFHKALLLDEYQELLPRPMSYPMYVKDGIRISYEEYEIAPYAAGMPSCLLSYATVKPLLSVTGQLLLPEAQLASR